MGVDITLVYVVVVNYRYSHESCNFSWKNGIQPNLMGIRLKRRHIAGFRYSEFFEVTKRYPLFTCCIYEP